MTSSCKATKWRRSRSCCNKRTRLTQNIYTGSIWRPRRVRAKSDTFMGYCNEIPGYGMLFVLLNSRFSLNWSRRCSISTRSWFMRRPIVRLTCLRRASRRSWKLGWKRCGVVAYNHLLPTHVQHVVAMLKTIATTDGDDRVGGVTTWPMNMEDFCWHRAKPTFCFYLSWRYSNVEARLERPTVSCADDVWKTAGNVS